MIATNKNVSCAAESISVFKCQGPYYEFAIYRKLPMEFLFQRKTFFVEPYDMTVEFAK